MTDKSLSVHIVSITAYLIGVKEEMFQREFKTSIYQLLETKPEAKIIRSLCLIRHALIRNYGAINSRLRNDAFTNLDKMPDYIDPAVFSYLSSQGITIIKTNPKAINYIIAVNGLINDRIQACKHLYPIWIEWDYIKKLFQMPRGGNEKEITKIIEDYHASLNSYPYHRY
ncbi:MAG: hypothetical protein IJH64_07490, partial [Oscillospiraceae bacterium]|nr:hypothetical protein [Oscillospiraceae bacterium]